MKVRFKLVKKIIPAILLIVSVSLTAQEYQNIKIDIDSLSNVSLKVYTPEFQAKMIYKDTIEAKNSNPEMLMSSIISADNQPWVDYNTIGGSSESDKKGEKHFLDVKNRNVEKNYFNLLSKLSFDYYGSKWAIVKFYLYLEEKSKPIGGSMVMQNYNGQWKVTSNSKITPIAMAMMIFGVKPMKNILLISPENEMEKELVKKVYSDKGLDISTLLSQKFDTNEKKYFINPLNW